AKKVKENYDKYEKPYKEANTKLLEAGKVLSKAEKALDEEKDAAKPDPAKVKMLADEVAKAKSAKEALDRELRPVMDRFEAWSNEYDRLTDQLKEFALDKQ